MEEEIWVTIADFPDYQVSNCGRVKSTKTQLIKKQGITRWHYTTRLNNNKKTKLYYVHRLIAMAFIPNPANKPCINHIDGDKLNNALLNLEWCTYAENNRHAIDNGLRGYRKGCSHVFSVFSKDEVLDIRNLYKSGRRIAEITRLYNRSRAAIYNIVKGISYREVA